MKGRGEVRRATKAALSSSTHVLTRKAVPSSLCVTLNEL